MAHALAGLRACRLAGLWACRLVGVRPCWSRRFSRVSCCFAAASPPGAKITPKLVTSVLSACTSQMVTGCPSLVHYNHSNVFMGRTVPIGTEVQPPIPQQGTLDKATC
ncbi:unnamed protein product [Polarella glacialis]|uniref:Uncharacterized protein n=1 Tax=Polarella glacialis TaxID=89957 RepID=A0A813LQE6_POLGL|nr:unnamed protein product [Polarella glacialis]